MSAHDKLSTFTTDMVRVPHARDVGMQPLEPGLGVFGAHGHRLGDLLVYDDVDLHAFFGFPLEETVQPVLVHTGPT